MKSLRYSKAEGSGRIGCTLRKVRHLIIHCGEQVPSDTDEAVQEDTVM